MRTFRPHTTDINTKPKQRLNAVRALTHTTYGHYKKDITLYEHFIRHILIDSHTACTPNTVNSLNTHITQDETLLLPLRSHMDMRGTHIFSSYSDPSHPLHYMQTPMQTPRHIHTTPANHYTDLLNSLPPPPPGHAQHSRGPLASPPRLNTISPKRLALHVSPPWTCSSERRPRSSNNNK